MKKKTKKGKMAKNREAVARAAEKKATKPNVAIVEHNGLMSLEQAKAHAEQGQEMTVAAVSNWWALALHAREGLEHGGPAALGLSTTKWYETIYRGSWQMIRRTVEHLKQLNGVPIEQLSQICDANAHVMRQLPEKLRTTKEWLDQAKNETPEEFYKAVYQKLSDLGQPVEAMVKTGEAFKLNRVPGSLVPLVMDCLNHAAKENDLDLNKKADRIDAFQVMVMHYHQTFCVEVPEEAGA